MLQTSEEEAVWAMQKYSMLIFAELQKSNGVCSSNLTGIKKHMCWGFQDHSFVLENPFTHFIFFEGTRICAWSDLLFVFLFLLTLNDHICVTSKKPIIINVNSEITEEYYSNSYLICLCLNKARTLNRLRICHSTKKASKLIKNLRCSHI